MSLADPTAPWYAHATRQRLEDRAAGRITEAESRQLAAEIRDAVWAPAGANSGTVPLAGRTGEREALTGSSRPATPARRAG
ncbi:MAG TPA: hypothetical protein VG276_28980 [Actinomycetes bacterium]|jgi:hypothetical protein|nr:hypothetical protein [Actinomycetes bacterium]